METTKMGSGYRVQKELKRKWKPLQWATRGLQLLPEFLPCKMDEIDSSLGSTRIHSFSLGFRV